MAYLFVYTRLENFDYRLIYAPDSQFLPQPIRGEFIEFAREVINSDNFGDIKIPRNAVIKRGSKTLIGIGCNNKELGIVTSSKENRVIRGFWGLYFDAELSDSQINTLVDINFYREIYAQYISPIWSTGKRFEDRINSIVQSIEISETMFQPNSEDIRVNCVIDLCRIHSCHSDASAIIKACLKCKEVDAVTFLNTEDHVSEAPLYRFHNATIVDSECVKDIHFGTSNKRRSEEDSQSKNTSIQSRRGKTVVATNSTEEKFTPINLPEGGTDNEDSCIYRIINKIIHYLSRAGICPKKFITLFAKKYGLEVVENNNINTNQSSCEQLDGAESIPSVSTIEEIESFHESKEVRKKGLAEIQARFKKTDEVLEPDEIDKPTIESEETLTQRIIKEIETTEKKTKNPFDLEELN